MRDVSIDSGSTSFDSATLRRLAWGNLDSRRQSAEESSPGDEQILRRHDVKIKNGHELTWEVSCRDHPRNWSSLSKAYATIIVSWLELYMTAISSSGAATAEAAMMDYGTSKTLSYFAFLTLYLLGQTIGGIACSPISEVFGRRTIYILAGVLFCISSIIVGAVPYSVAVFIGRFFQGVAAAIPATVAFGTFSDMYDAHTRVWTVYLYTFAGMIGLAGGPIFSAYVSAYAGWRWVYYISAIVAAVSVLASCFLRESNAGQLLEARAKAVRADTGVPEYHAEGAHDKPSLSDFAKKGVFLPIEFLVTEPIVFFCAVLCAIAFGLVYGLTEALSVVYMAPPFNFSQTSASLSFVAIIIGEVINVLPRVYDHALIGRHTREGKRIVPETKIRSFAVACPALAIGLWIFAWTIPPRVTTVPWPVSMIGLVLVGFALNDFSYVLFGYATDSYGPQAASAVSAVSLTRTLTAAVFPLFTTQMFNGLGNNIATTILAAVATAFCFTPVLFLGYGARLRRHSKVASNDEDALEEENQHLLDNNEKKPEA